MRTLRDGIGATALSLGLTHDNNIHYLRRRHLDSYRDKLAPLFPDAYFQQLDNFHTDLKDGDKGSPRLDRSAAVLLHALDVPLISITNLYVQPGDPDFVFWLAISSYFPCLSACCAPIGNFISLIALIEHWRLHKETGHFIVELPPAKVLNVLGFALGIIGNISLLMNFSGTLAYVLTQGVSIGCWFGAATMLLTALLLTNRDYLESQALVNRTAGFWLAVWTVVMYYSCSITLSINLLGYRLKKYPASFTLDKKQRLLMHYTIVFAVWQAIGAVVMKHLFKDLNYGSSIYFCTVSMLTVGLGDVVPKSTGSRIFTLVFSFVGIIIMGLIVTTLSRVVISSAEPSVFWHRIEVQRHRIVQNLKREGRSVGEEESFEIMKALRESARRRQKCLSVLTTISTFVAFWLLGALAFTLSESWNYFEAIYFCFLCLITIGYGDFTPKSAFGRAFFVVWAIAAVPLMTIIISTVGNLVFFSAQKFDEICNEYLIGKPRKIPPQIEREFQEALKNNLKDTSSISGLTMHTHLEGLEESQRIRKKQKDTLLAIAEDLEIFRDVMFDMIDDSSKTYTRDEWDEIIRHLQRDDEEKERSKNEGFWLGDTSPLRLPLKEPNFAFLKIYNRLRNDFKEVLQLQKEEANIIDEFSCHGYKTLSDPSDMTEK